MLVNEALKYGVENIAVGMAHRGRFNVAHCSFDASAESIYELYLDQREHK